jgi:hypothetical protein
VGSGRAVWASFARPVRRMGFGRFQQHVRQASWNASGSAVLRGGLAAGAALGRVGRAVLLYLPVLIAHAILARRLAAGTALEVALCTTAIPRPPNWPLPGPLLLLPVTLPLAVTAKVSALPATRPAAPAAPISSTCASPCWDRWSGRWLADSLSPRPLGTRRSSGPTPPSVRMRSCGLRRAGRSAGGCGSGG